MHQDEPASDSSSISTHQQAGLVDKRTLSACRRIKDYKQKQRQTIESQRLEIERSISAITTAAAQKAASSTPSTKPTVRKSSAGKYTLVSSTDSLSNKPNSAAAASAAAFRKKPLDGSASVTSSAMAPKPQSYGKAAAQRSVSENLQDLKSSTIDKPSTINLATLNNALRSRSKPSKGLPHLQHQPSSDALIAARSINVKPTTDVLMNDDSGNNVAKTAAVVADAEATSALNSVLDEQDVEFLTPHQNLDSISTQQGFIRPKVFRSKSTDIILHQYSINDTESDLINSNSNSNSNSDSNSNSNSNSNGNSNSNSNSNSNGNSNNNSNISIGHRRANSVGNLIDSSSSLLLPKRMSYFQERKSSESFDKYIEPTKPKKPRKGLFNKFSHKSIRNQRKVQ